MPQAELPARGIDIMAFFLPDCMRDACLLEDFGESLLAFDIRAFPWQSLNPVVGNEIYMGMEFVGDPGKPSGLVIGIIHFLNQDKFQGQHAASLF